MRVLQGIKSSVPQKMRAAGFALSAVLMVRAIDLTLSEFTYYRFLMRGFLLENAVFIFVECMLASFLFEYFLRRNPNG